MIHYMPSDSFTTARTAELAKLATAIAAMDSRLNELIDRLDLIDSRLPPLNVSLESDLRPASRTHDGRIVVDVDAWQRFERIEKAAWFVALGDYKPASARTIEQALAQMDSLAELIEALKR